MDLLIAAHARAVGATVVTNDNAFKHADLPLVNWATDLPEPKPKPKRNIVIFGDL
jgi:hypothetical protein